MIEIKIKPSVELFFDSETFFGIYASEVNPEDSDKVTFNNYGNISVKGVSQRLEIGREYTVKVKKEKGSKYEGSYLLESVKQERPETPEEQKDFLKSILTELQVKNIYDVYGEDEDIVGMIERGEFDYSNVKGIGDKVFDKLQEKVITNLDMSESLVFFSKYGIKYGMIAKLMKVYKNPLVVIEKIKENPYLLTEVKGVGFIKADEIAKSIGYELTSAHRIDSCLRYCISEENQDGHSWISYRKLLNKSIDYLNIKKNFVEERLELVPDKMIRIDDKFSLKTIYDAEKYIATKITNLTKNSKKVFDTDELDKMIDDYCEKHNIELETNQCKFFHDWNENNILMLVGGGGMGKTYLQKILLEFIDSKHLTTALLAPTGKASKVIQGYTNRPASTIHRKAGIFGDGEEGSKEIYEDVIIIDESSMCDVFILSKFFRAVSNHNARILFVGDDFQLPSVGVGNFLYDVLNSNEVKISRLKKVFRQKDGGILNVATDVREGRRFLNDSDEGRIVFGKDCVFWLTEQTYVRDGILSNYKRVLKRYSQDDIVVLTPTNKGKLGTIELNKEIQKIANPASPNKKEKSVGKKDNQIIFRVGDIVMNIVNSYDVETVDGGIADIYNGDTGKIIDIDEEENDFIVEIDDIQVKIPFGTVLNNLRHSWVTTIHKSQGSQYKVTIVVADKSSTYQLNANLLYTGFSRASEYMLVLGQAQTINRAMRKYTNMDRRSFLQDLLSELNQDKGDNNIA